MEGRRHVLARHVRLWVGCLETGLLWLLLLHCLVLRVPAQPFFDICEQGRNVGLRKMWRVVRTVMLLLLLLLLLKLSPITGRRCFDLLLLLRRGLVTTSVAIKVVVVVSHVPVARRREMCVCVGL